jgi:hypothetical protein
VAAWTVWALVMVACLAVPWLDQLLRPAGRADLVQRGPPPRAGCGDRVTVGVVLAARRPSHPVGWLLLGQAVSLLATGAAAQYLTWGLLAQAGPGAQSAESATHAH